jgi:hypothetical protein
MGTVGSPSCSDCPGVIDEVQHRLLECPNLEAHRTPLLNALRRLKLPFDLTTLLNFEDVPYDHKADLIIKLGEFLSRSGLDRLFLWDPRY